MEATIPLKKLHSKEYQGHEKKVHSVDWNCIGTKVASGSVYQTAWIWHIEPHGHDDELTILDVRKFKAIHKRKFNFEVNEIAWNMRGDMFFLTTGNGTIEVLAYPSLQAVSTLMAHTTGCYCIAIDPLGRDALRANIHKTQVARTISFNYTGEYIASASEDSFMDIGSSSRVASAEIVEKKCDDEDQLVREGGRGQSSLFGKVDGKRLA